MSQPCVILWSLEEGPRHFNCAAKMLLGRPIPKSVGKAGIKIQKWLEPQFSLLVVKGMVIGETTSIQKALSAWPPNLHTQQEGGQQESAPVTVLEAQCKNQEDFQHLLKSSIVREHYRKKWCVPNLGFNVHKSP